MQKKMRRKRRTLRLIAGMAGALLLTGGGMAHHSVPTAKAAPQWETLLPDNLGEVWERSRENIEERVRESIRDNLNQKIQEKKEEWGREILERLHAPVVSRANKVMDHMQAAAYVSAHDGLGERLHSGTKARPGVIAADPSLIPFGTQVYIEFEDGKGMYAVAKDTGRSVTGRRVDIAVTERHRVEEFAVRPVRVHILSAESGNIA